MKFLIDEDVPVKILKTLVLLGHDAKRIEAGSSDTELARRAKREERIIITLDKDFSNTLMYPPSQFNIILLRIQPSLVEPMITAIKNFLATTLPNELKGLILLQNKGHLRISE